MGVTLILQYDVQGVNNPWEPTEDGEEDVDDEVGVASTLEKHSQWRKEEGEDDLYYV